MVPCTAADVTLHAELHGPCMMRFVLIAAALAMATTAAAHNAGPCNDSDEPGHSAYAQHHIRPVAHSGDAGAVDHDGDGAAHTPGSHQGYSACDPSG